MNKKIAVLAGILVVSLVMLACSLPVFEAQLQQKDIQAISDSVLQTMSALNQQSLAQQPINSAQVIATSVAQTVVALNAQNQAAQAAQAAAAVPTPIPYVYYPAPTATYYPCNSAIMVYETVPDYTNFSINQTFNKTWTLKNVGVCTWNTGYRLAFYSGNSLNAPAYVYLPYSVGPGGTVTVSVPMQAPSYSGTFTGYWGLYTDANVYFGKIWVTITAGSVISPTSTTFAVTSVSISLASPADCRFSAAITANGVGTVTYTWMFSVTPYTTFVNEWSDTLTFSGPGLQTLLVNDLYYHGNSYQVHMYINSPNHQEFGSSTIFTCP